MHFSSMPWDMAAPSVRQREPYSPDLHSATVGNENAYVFVNNYTPSLLTNIKIS